MIKDGQVRELFRLLRLGRRLAFAARKTGMDEKTARKYREAKQLPSERVTPRQWRTRPDPFEQVWPLVQRQLQQEPQLRAVTLFRWLQDQHRGEFPDSQRRTFERKVRTWRATQGPGPAVMFAQVHYPGDLAASDFTHMDSLGVTLGGQPFSHLVYHFTLTYSNWESVTVCPSESFEALSEGLQNALWELGGVPRRHRSDSLSAAVNNLSEQREFHQRYRDFLEYYGLEGQRINVRQPHENGDAESSHGHFKEAVDQALRLRGSRDFAGREEYLRFLRELVAARNANRQQRFIEELAALRPLPPRRLESSRRLPEVSVGPGSTIRVLKNCYSVPSRLIGQKVEVVLGVDEVEVWHGGILVQRMPRLPGSGKHAINYRHIIDSLVRKPGAFANYVYRADLFPTSHFRMAYDALCGKHAEKAATREYLRILQLAARESEAAVEAALRAALTRGEEVSFAAIRAAVQSSQQVPAVTEVHVEAVDLRVFDSLLDHSYMEVGSHEFSVQEDISLSVVNEQAIVAIACPGVVPDGQRPVAEGVAGEQPGGERPVAEGIDGEQRLAERADDERVADERAVASVAVGAAADAGLERGVEGAVSGTAIADVPRALPEPGRRGRAGVAEPSAVFAGADAAGMPGASAEPHPAVVGAIAAAASEELGELRLAADSPARGASGGEPQGRGLPGPPREPAAVWQARLGEDALRVCAGRATGASGPFDPVYELRPLGAEPAGGQAGSALRESAQAPLALRGPDPRRPGLRAAEPRGNGSPLHLAGRALRAGERAPDEQSAVLQVGADLQGCHDHRRGHRPLGASLRDLGIERAQLPPRNRPTESPIELRATAWCSASMITTCTQKF